MYGIKPLKRLGQNFLIDKNVVKKVIKAAELHSKDIVLEIGPGIGALTKETAKKAGKIIAVEKDPRMIETLRENLKGFKNIEIINKDILKYNFQFSKNYKIVANLPFYITAPVIRKFLESKYPPKEMVLIVQKEVAQRICSKPCPHRYAKRCRRAPKMNILAVSVQFYAKPKIISYVSKKSFWPSPKVDSAIIKISVFNQRRKSAFNQRFFKIVKAGFAHPRKQLANNLINELAMSLPNRLKLNKQEVNDLLLKSGIKPSQRAETLTIQDWINLSNDIYNS